MSELRKMTRMGGDLRKIARLLQDKGRKGDTILAHINPREAALLREQGGSGTINPETGLMEFEDGFGGDYVSGYTPPDPVASPAGYEQVPEGLFEGAAYGSKLAAESMRKKQIENLANLMRGTVNPEWEKPTATNQELAKMLKIQGEK